MNQGYPPPPAQPRQQRPPQTQPQHGMVPAKVVMGLVDQCKRFYHEVGQSKSQSEEHIRKIDAAMRHLELDAGQLATMMVQEKQQYQADQAAQVELDRGIHHLAVWLQAAFAVAAMERERFVNVVRDQEEALNVVKFFQGELMRWLRGQAPTGYVSQPQGQPVPTGYPQPGVIPLGQGGSGGGVQMPQLQMGMPQQQQQQMMLNPGVLPSQVPQVVPPPFYPQMQPQPQQLPVVPPPQMQPAMFQQQPMMQQPQQPQMQMQPMPQQMQPPMFQQPMFAPPGYPQQPYYQPPAAPADVMPAAHLPIVQQPGIVPQQVSPPPQQPMVSPPPVVITPPQHVEGVQSTNGIAPKPPAS